MKLILLWLIACDLVSEAEDESSYYTGSSRSISQSSTTSSRFDDEDDASTASFTHTVDEVSSVLTSSTFNSKGSLTNNEN